MNDSHVIGKEQCPECARLGKDNSSDNLAIYSDGHKWCYSCGYYEGVSPLVKFKHVEKEVEKKDPLTLPSDCDIVYPERALDWIKQYELNKVDLLNNNVMWSDSMQRLIFPVYGDDWLIAYQGRYFGAGNMAIAKIPKWYGKGNLKDTFNILGKGDELILTEDVVSAIKVAKCGVMALPLYGCVVGTIRFKRLLTILGTAVKVRVWLDPDKRSDAVREAKLGRCVGLNCGTIFSERDPKEHTFSEIKEILK